MPTKKSKKTPVKTKKEGYTVTFRAQPKTDPFMARPGTCECCGHVSQKTKPNQTESSGIPLYIRQLAQKLG